MGLPTLFFFISIIRCGAELCLNDYEVIVHELPSIEKYPSQKLPMHSSLFLCFDVSATSEKKYTHTETHMYTHINIYISLYKYNSLSVQATLKHCEIHFHLIVAYLNQTGSLHATD